MFSKEGDRIGLVRKTGGALHYFINGNDQGMAVNHSPQPVWGVVDLYGMAVKVTIIDSSEPPPMATAAVRRSSETGMALNNRANTFLRSLNDTFDNTGKTCHRACSDIQQA